MRSAPRAGRALGAGVSACASLARLERPARLAPHRMARKIRPRPRNKKRRPLPYRLRAMREFRRWSRSFDDYFPPAEELAEHPRYWHWKVPIDAALVEGEHARPATRREFAQLLIDACAAMIRAKPGWAAGYRVTCVLCVPDLWTSELCVYLDEAYFREHTGARRDEHGEQAPIAGRSLAAQWGLSLPRGLDEHGVLWKYDASADPGDHYLSEHWHFGEVRPDRDGSAPG